MSRGRLLLTAVALIVGAAGAWAITGGGESDGGASSRAQAATVSMARLPTYGNLGRSHTVVVRELPAAPAAAVALEEPVVLPRRDAPFGVRVSEGGVVRPPAANALAGVTRLGAQTAAPNILKSFEGLGSTDNPFGLTPPDPQIAVGPDHVVSFVNITGRIFDKNGSTVSTFLLVDLFGVPPGYRDTDPRVIYDALSGRWFAAYSSSIDNASGDDEGLLHLAVSKTSDPTGLWNVYEVSYVDVLPDYPGIGLTDDKVTLSANLFDIDVADGGDVSPGCSSVSGYCGEQTIVIEKSHLLDGLPGEDVDVTFFPTHASRFTVRPAHSLSSVNDQYLTTWNLSVHDQLTVIRITGTPAGGDVVETTVTNLVTLEQHSPPVSETAGSGDCVAFGETLGPPPCIHSGDFRMLEAIWRDNSLWSAASAVCTPPGDSTDRSCAHLVEVATDGQPSLVQDIMFGASGEYFSWPSIRTDSSGNLFVSLTHTSPSIFAEASVAGRLASDPPNTMSALTVLRAGEIAHFSGRWGDYLGVAVDPADPSSVWLIGQYAKADGAVRWGTYIGCASFTTFGCGLATPTPTPTATATPTATPCPDNDGDTICDGVDTDDDNDGCTDVAELQTALGSEFTGGRRDPLDFWDFYDPNRDRAVSLGDFLAVLARFGSVGDPGIDPLSPVPLAPAYHTRFDRTGAPPGADLWQAGPPDGSIGLTDFLALLAQFGHSCAAPDPTPTALPSVTPTPTATPTPLTTPTSTVAPLDGSVSIRNSSWYVDIIGAIWVVGEVVNGLDHPAALVEVSVDLYSASNTLIDTGNGIACVITMASGSDSPFTVLVIGPPPDVDHVVVQVTDFLEPPFFIIDPPIVDLDAAITNVFTDSIGFRHAVGTVVNNSPSTYELVQPCLAFYNAAGNVVRTGSTFTNPITLAPSQMGTFEAFVDAEGVSIVTERVWVNANYAD